MNKRTFLVFFGILATVPLLTFEEHRNRVQEFEDVLSNFTVLYFKYKEHTLFTKDFFKEVQMAYGEVMEASRTKYGVADYLLKIEDQNNVDHFKMIVFWNYKIGTSYFSFTVEVKRKHHGKLKFDDI